MSKWERIGNNSVSTIYDGMTREQIRAEKIKKARAFDKVIKNTKSEDIAGLKKAGDNSYNAATARKESIMTAFSEKKLKSKNLIKEAKAIKIAQDKAAAKKKEKAEATA